MSRLVTPRPKDWPNPFVGALRIAAGVFLIALGIALALYVGLWLWVGGIVQMIESAKDDPVNGVGLLVGFLRMASAPFVGWGIFVLCAIIGAVLIDDA